MGQLDVLTQTMALLDERLTMNEDRVQAMGDKLDSALAFSAMLPAATETVAGGGVGASHSPTGGAKSGAHRHGLHEVDVHEAGVSDDQSSQQGWHAGP